MPILIFSPGANFGHHPLAQSGGAIATPTPPFPPPLLYLHTTCHTNVYRSTAQIRIQGAVSQSNNQKITTFYGYDVKNVLQNSLTKQT